MIVKSKLLTQEEVDRLPNGARVQIVWSGGNGPHAYTIQRKGLAVIAVEANEFIHFVGRCPLTEVRRIEESKNGD